MGKHFRFLLLFIRKTVCVSSLLMVLKRYVSCCGEEVTGPTSSTPRLGELWVPTLKSLSWRFRNLLPYFYTFMWSLFNSCVIIFFNVKNLLSISISGKSYRTRFSRRISSITPGSTLKTWRPADSPFTSWAMRVPSQGRWSLMRHPAASSCSGSEDTRPTLQCDGH